MSEKSQLTVKVNIEELSKNFKDSRKGLLDEEKRACDLIEEKTKKEKIKLEEAYKEYNNSIRKVLASNEYKNIENKAREHSLEIKKNLLKAKKEFMKIREHIMKQNWTEDKKQKKLKELYDYILKKLYTKEEIEQFQSIMQQIVVFPLLN